MEADAGAARPEQCPRLRPPREQPEADSREMQRRRGEHEARDIAPGIGECGDLLPVRVAVEDREDGDRGHRGRHGEGEGERDGEAEREDGEGDHPLDLGQRLAGEAERPAEAEEEDEGGRHGQDGASAELHREESDRHHGEEMVEAEHRVQESRGEAVAAEMLGLRGQGGEGEGDGTQGFLP